jgi:hypothetical protein
VPADAFELSPAKYAAVWPAEPAASHQSHRAISSLMRVRTTPGAAFVRR